MEGYKIERKNYIERDPQALSLDQIRCAREAALYVMSTHSMEEAMRIFTEGLQPVQSFTNGNMNMMMDWDEDEEELDPIEGDYILAGFRDSLTTTF